MHLPPKRKPSTHRCWGGVPIARTIVDRDLYRGPSLLGDYHLAFKHLSLFGGYPDFFDNVPCTNHPKGNLVRTGVGAGSLGL